MGALRSESARAYLPSRGAAAVSRVRARGGGGRPRALTQRARAPGAQGSAGAPGPPARELAAALAARALFVYCGHGAGEAWVGARSLRRLPACAAALLMGCSSGRLAPAGAYEPAGPVLAYLLAGARPSLHRALRCSAASGHRCWAAAGASRCRWLLCERVRSRAASGLRARLAGSRVAHGKRAAPDLSGIRACSPGAHACTPQIRTLA